MVCSAWQCFRRQCEVPSLVIFQKCEFHCSPPDPASTLRKVHAALQIHNLRDAPGPASNRQGIKLVSGHLLQIVGSLACESVAYIFWTRLWRSELRLALIGRLYVLHRRRM